MKLFIDTEFNDYKGDLISMALVDENGAHFYQSLGCENPSPWVAENVIPVLFENPIPKQKMQVLLCEFLMGYDSIHIVADWPEDIQHFCEMLITGPGMRIDTPPLTMEVLRDLGAVSLLPHNALADARAIRFMALRLAQTDS